MGHTDRTGCRTEPVAWNWVYSIVHKSDTGVHQLAQRTVTLSDRNMT